MFIEFSFGNFRSFKEIQSLNMSAAKINEHIDTNTIAVNDKLSLLKSKAIYGANASGKSNVVKALGTFIKIIKNSVKIEGILELIEHFHLSEDTDNMPSFFQLIFLLNGIQYRYGFETTYKEIVSEWLYGTPNQREVCFFIREGNIINEISEKHFEEGKKLLSLFGNDSEIFRNNSLFLSAISAMNGKLSKQISNEIANITVLTGINDRQLVQMAGVQIQNDDKREDIINFLKFCDVSILKLDLMELTKDIINEDAPQEIVNLIEDGKRVNLILSGHQSFNKDKELNGVKYMNFQRTQSEGTIKMFELSPIIMNALKQGKTLIIDEFDARFHPLITKKIVELFNSKANKNAQLIFVTHDTNLLSHDLLRRDQIDFVEKDKYAASHIYSLVQFKGIRNNASFEKDYISGKYGAIPFLGDFNKLFNTEKDA